MTFQFSVRFGLCLSVTKLALTRESGKIPKSSRLVRCDQERVGPSRSVCDIAVECEKSRVKV